MNISFNISDGFIGRPVNEDLDVYQTLLKSKWSQSVKHHLIQLFDKS